jgi:hypothetical protein
MTCAIAVVLVWGFTGCGGGGGGGSSKVTTPKVDEGSTTTSKPVTAEKKPDAGKKSDADKTASAPAGEEGWGTIKGQIVWAKEIPELEMIVKQGDQNVKDAAVCAVQDIYKEEVVVNKDNKGLQWVLVYLGGKPKIHPDLKEAEGTVELGQKYCRFIPHVAAMRQGQKLLITSDDPIAHNTKGDGFKNPPFNPVISPAPPGGRSELAGPDLVAENLPITIACNIHPHMKAYLAVYAHPYFAVTDENGEFAIENVPAGELKLNIWHEKGGYGEGGKEGKAISVKAGETTDLGKIDYAPK